MGGISLPLLADFHPKGAMADSFGLYLSDKGITDRATVLIDADGVIQHISAVGPGGERDIDELVTMCEKVDAEYKGELGAAPTPAGLADGTVVYIKEPCTFSQNVLAAFENLHVQDKITVKNVSKDDAARSELKEKTGGEQAPAIIYRGESMLESADIIKRVVTDVQGW